MHVSNACDRLLDVDAMLFAEFIACAISRDRRRAGRTRASEYCTSISTMRRHRHSELPRGRAPSQSGRQPAAIRRSNELDPLSGQICESRDALRQPIGRVTRADVGAR